MLAGINDILVISTPEDGQFFELMGDCSTMALVFIVQPKPEGIAKR